jgi:hypothetical protein
MPPPGSRVGVVALDFLSAAHEETGATFLDLIHLAVHLYIAAI